MTDNLGSYLIIIGLTVFVIYLLIQGYRSSICPKCKADYFNIAKTKQEYLGEDFGNPEKHIFRNHYSCRRCEHKWTKDSYESRNN